MKRRRKKPIGKVFTLLLVAIFVLAIDTRQVSAHAFLLRTDPADGSVLISAPEQMRLWFSEPLEIDLTTINLINTKNKTWELKPYADAEDPTVFIVDLPELPPNAYHVFWRTVSDEDLHVISGSIVFGIQQPVSREGTAQTQSETPLAEVAFHWMGLLSFAALIGALINSLFLFPAVKTKFQDVQNLAILSGLQIKMIWLALWCNVIALIAGSLTLWAKSVNIQPVTSLSQFWELIAGSVFIQRGLAGEGILLITVFLILAWLKQIKFALKGIIAKLGIILLFSLAALWIILQALNSHASAFNDFSAVRVIVYALHLLGAGLWIGGQAALIFFVAPRLKVRNKEHVLAREIYARFGGIAVIGVALLIVTGLYSGGQQVASVDALLLTRYGRTVILKLVLVMLTGLIGFWHSSIFHPRIARILFKLAPYRIVLMVFGKANPTVTLRLQLLGGAAIFLLASFMGSTTPARGPEFEAPLQAASTESGQPISLSNMADDLLVNFSIKPNQPGQNFIRVDVFNTRRPSPGDIEQVKVKLLPAGGGTEVQIDVPLSELTGAGNYQISTEAIQSSGDMKVSIVVHRAGLEDAVLELPWQVAPSAPIAVNRPTFISSRPLTLILTSASLFLAFLLGVIWLVITLKPNLLHWFDDKGRKKSKEMNL